MATNKNITMKQFNGTDYDILYPKTIASQVSDIYTKEQILTDTTKTNLGLPTSAVPDDAFEKLSNSVLRKTTGGTPIRVATNVENFSIGQEISIEGKPVICCGTDYPTTNSKIFIAKTQMSTTYRYDEPQTATNAYLGSFSVEMQSIFLSVSIGSTVSSQKCFIPSYIELGGTGHGDGTAIPYFNSNSRRATGTEYMTRTNEDIFYGVVTLSGALNYASVATQVYYRPMFVLSNASTLYLDPDGNYYINQYTPPIINSLTDMQGNDFPLPYAKITTGSYTGTGTFGTQNPTIIAIPNGTRFVTIYLCRTGLVYNNYPPFIIDLSVLTENYQIYRRYLIDGQDTIANVEMKFVSSMLYIKEIEYAERQFNSSGNKYFTMFIGGAN